MNISKKLPIAAAILVLITVGVASTASYMVASQHLIAKSNEKIQAIADDRRNQVETYLNEIDIDIKRMSKDEQTANAFIQMSSAFGMMPGGRTAELQRRYITDNPNPTGEKHKLDTAGKDTYDKGHKKYHHFLREFIEFKGYYDLFLVNDSGDVIYSVYKELDYATNLEGGEWKDTGLARVWNDVMNGTESEDKVAIDDYAPYAPSADAPASFIGKRLTKRGRVLGTLILQMPNDKIEKIMGNTTGMGGSGETMLLRNDTYMITDSRKTEFNEALNTKLDLSKKLLEESYTDVPVDYLKGYRDDLFHIATARVKFEDNHWIVATIAADHEVTAGATELRNTILFISLILLLVSTIIVFFFSRSITKLINNIVDDMSELVDGNTNLELSGASRNDEIGKIFKAVSVFQDAAIEKRHLEEQSEVNRAQADRDRTARETEAAEQATHMRVVVGNLGAGFWSVDLATNEVEWSSQVRKIHEVGPDYIPTLETAIAFYDPESQIKISDDLARCQNEGAMVDKEYVIVTAKGRERRVRVFANVVSEIGQSKKLIGTFQDITELAIAREALEESNERLELATESGAIGLWDWSIKENIIWVHPNWWKHLGFSEAQEESSDDNVHPDDLNILSSERSAFLAKKKSSFEVETRVLDGKGDWRWILSTGKTTDRNTDGSIARVSGVFVDIHKRKLAEQEIEYAARHDIMTGLVNREEVRRGFNETIASDRREKLCLFALDLDRFKHVNDTFGHEAGDVVLKTVTSRLKRIVRGKDIVARLGGDEFSIVMPTGANWQDIGSKFAQRAIDVICKPVKYHGASLQVGASIGVAVYPDHGADFDTLLRNADAALYKVKGSGKNNYYIFDEELDQEGAERRELEADLANAIPKGELELYFQKQIDLNSNETLGAEALLRWKHPTRGMIPPDVFIPLAEENGLIVPIGQWVIKEACEKASAWPKPWIVSVNLSAMQLGKSDLYTWVIENLMETGLAPERLEIEVTESVFLTNDGKLLGDLHKLHKIGVKLALDDFGTGYASLGYLQKLPFTKIKLDRSFVSDIGTNQQSAEIALAIATLCRNLGLETTAEGIETNMQRDLIRDAGYTYGQGYLFAKPVPNDVFIASETEGLALKSSEVSLRVVG